mgnify:CR=1 FL=1
MKKIILNNPSVSSLNIGDEIIFDSCNKIIESIYPDSFFVNISTHLPISVNYMRLLRKVELRFVCGSNLLDSRNFPFKQWDVSLIESSILKPQTILLGVGWRQYQRKTNLYSKLLYRSILSKKYLHSVRDRYTERKLRDMGFKNVINTGCPTMWNLNESHCSTIPKTKGRAVVFTLTDYNTDEKKDLEFIRILEKNYEKLYFWIQGINDYEYLKSLNCIETMNIAIIPPNLRKYDELLESESDLDFVGTRLHGGIRALQKKKRAIIIGVDNRAKEKQKDFNLPVIDRLDISSLEEMLYSKEPIKINLPIDEISKWREQFLVEDFNA